MPKEYVLDSLTSGVTTTEELEAEPYGFRVSWIRWHSGFRGTNLRIGDRVLGVNGQRYDKGQRKSFVHKAFGSYSEGQHWAEIGAKDGQTVTVTVKRGNEVLDVQGTVRAERTWRNDNERPTLGPGGPETLSNDGFSGPWSGWLEKQIEDFGSRVLDGGWWRGTVSNNRQMLAEHLEQKARVDYLVKNFPGPFAEATAADWKAVFESLQGKRYELSDADLAWRSLGEKRAAEIAAQAKSAREAFLAAVAAETIPPFPAVDPIRGDRAQVAGKVVVLPPLKHRDWVMEGGKAWMFSGGGRDGMYFVDTTSPPMQRALVAGYRYQKWVSPNLPEVHAVIGRIGPNPKMLVRDGTAIAGLLVEAIAVSFGDALFVDLTKEKDGASGFAGEESLGVSGENALPDDAPPERVFEAFFEAEKMGAEERWKSLFATWEASLWDGKPWYRPLYGPSPSTLSSEWIRARRLLETKIFDVRIADVRPAWMIFQGTEFEGAPKVEQVQIEADHVGLFDGEHRGFKDVNTTRLWTLQRRDGGPWRIITQKGI